MLKKRWANFIKECYAYDNIPLRVYFEIAKGGDLKLLSKKNIPNDVLSFVWEDIIRRNGRETNSFNYDMYFNSVKNYALLLNEYNLVKACLSKLVIRRDKKIILLLKEKGYDINGRGSREEYIESLNNAFRKSDNLMTKLKSKQKEIERLTYKNGDSITLPQAIARINSALGYAAVNSETPLAEYNEYKKIAYKKHGRDRKVGLNK